MVNAVACSPCRTAGLVCGAPLAPGTLGKFQERLPVGSAREALEATLLELEEREQGQWMMLLREGRAAYLPVLSAARGRLGLVGNALSGASIALLRAGFEVLLFDRCLRRLAAAVDYAKSLLGPNIPVAALPFDGRNLPIEEQGLDVLILESPGPPFGLGLALPGAEAARVARREVLLIGENRLAYKRSSGVRADFHLVGPLELAARLLRPLPGEHSLAGHRRALRALQAASTESFALYPHSNDWSHLVALDRQRPQLTVGPMEKKNRAKLFARRLGLMPWLTPSFGILARLERGAGAQPAWRELLARAAASAGEPTPELDVLIATRGNTAVLQTLLADRAPTDPTGRFTVHIALSPQQEVQARRHYARLGEIAERFPGFPIPAPLHEEQGPLGHATAERRLPGFSAAQFTGHPETLAPLYRSLAEQLARLVVAPARPLDSADWERLFGARVELVARRAPDPSTRQALVACGEIARQTLVGVPFPRVLYHSDLRAKHVATDARGRLFGVLDWGSSEDQDLPYFDLLNLILHDRKQAAGRSIAWAWQLVRAAGPAGLAPHESAALEDYAQRLALPPIYCRTIERTYPLLVSAMAEANWDYSRPDWVQKNFGL